MGAEDGVIALSSLSQRACVETMSGLGLAQRETQLHKHAGHSMGMWAGRGGWAPYCILGVGPASQLGGYFSNPSER